MIVAEISGQARAAIAYDGEGYFLIKADDPSRVQSIGAAAAHKCLLGISDVVIVKEERLDGIKDRLLFETKRDQTLHLILQALSYVFGMYEMDASDLNDLEECLSENLVNLHIREAVLGVMCSDMLGHDFDEAARQRLGQLGNQFELFFNEVWSAQEVIECIGSQLREALARSGKRDLQYESLWSKLKLRGAIRDLTLALMGKVSPSLAEINVHKALMSTANGRKVATELCLVLKNRTALRRENPTAALRSSGMTGEDSLDAGAEPSRRYERPRTVTVHDAFTFAIAEQAEITKCIVRGEYTKAIQRADWLCETQLRTSDPRYASMSLCALAQKAKRIGASEVQLYFARKATEARPDDGWAHGQLADALIGLGRFPEAENALKDAEIFSEVAFAQTCRARIYREAGDLEKAELLYREAIESFPQNEHSHYGLAETLREMFRLDEALASYEAILGMLPRDLVAWNGHASVLIELGRLDEALAEYDQIIAHHPDDVYAYCGRAGVLRQMGKLKDAVGAFREAVALFPGSSAPLLGLCSCLVESGEITHALNEYNSAAKVYTWDAAVYVGQIEALRALRRYDEAKVQLEVAKRSFPFNSRLRSQSAGILEDQGKFVEALSEYEKTLIDFPHDRYASRAKARLLRRLGQEDAALSAYDELIGLAPQDPMLRYYKASLLASLSRFDEAVQLLPDNQNPRTRADYYALHVRYVIQIRQGAAKQVLSQIEGRFGGIPFRQSKELFAKDLALARLMIGRAADTVVGAGPVRDDIGSALLAHEMIALGDPDRARRLIRVPLDSLLPVIRRLYTALDDLIQHPSPARQFNVFECECRALLLAA